MKKVILYVLAGLFVVSCTSPSNHTQLTACLAEKKVVMFGASWCPHCADQKNMFGRSAKDMPYFECSKGKTQVQECSDRAIESYPTWQFNEETLKTLPELAQIDLFNSELDKVRASIALIREAIPGDNTASLKIVNDFSAETEAMVISDMTPFIKLTRLTSLTIGTDGKSVVKMPAYRMGRITGVRTLEQIALYSGCMDAYKQDTVPVVTQ